MNLQYIVFLSAVPVEILWKFHDVFEKFRVKSLSP